MTKVYPFKSRRKLESERDLEKQVLASFEAAVQQAAESGLPTHVGQYMGRDVYVSVKAEPSPDSGEDG